MQYIKSLILAVSALALASASAVPNAEAEPDPNAAAIVGDTSFTENVWENSIETRQNGRCRCRMPHGGKRKYCGNSSIIINGKRNHRYQCYRGNDRCKDLGRKRRCGANRDDNDTDTDDDDNDD